MRCFAALTFCLLFSGCIVLQPRAENPYPNMNTVAVVPFFNQSAVPGEINDLGRTFGLAYTSELQKFSGYDVMPMGVVETAIIEYNKAAEFRQEPQLNLGSPEDVLILADLLDVDAIVIGAITYYDPYYPPEIGMKVNWYSTKNWTMSPLTEPCGPCDESLQDENGECPCDIDWPKLRTKDNHSIIRGQNAVPLFEHEAEPLFGYESNPPRITSQGSTAANRSMSAEPPAKPEAGGTSPAYVRSFQPAVTASRMTEPSPSPVQLLHPETLIPLGDDPADWGGVTRETPQGVHLANQAPLPLIPEVETVVQADVQSLDAPPLKLHSRLTVEESETEVLRIEPIPLDPALLAEPGTVIEIQRDHTIPVMSYTQIFDGKNEDTVSLLRDYVEIQGDKRSGGWEGYMQRTDDYIKFCCHMMIVDMLSVHGGALRTKVWLKIRKNP